MRNKDTDNKKSSCSECPSTFILVPPADNRYNLPREKADGSDFLKRVYECEDEGHRNTIFWEKQDHRIVIVSRDPREDIDSYRSGLY